MNEGMHNGILVVYDLEYMDLHISIEIYPRGTESYILTLSQMMFFYNLGMSATVLP